MVPQDQIEKSSKEIHSDGYSMSIGELMNMYEKDELDIHPEFQRFFRWELPQKARLIESILIGIPLPSIFVAQRDDGVWDVVDGLQRLSTVFQLAGILCDDKGQKLSPLRLESTKYLPDLQDKVWSSEFGDNALTQAQRLYIKRAKIDVKIIKKESTPSSKYELFQRLNTGGSPLTDQEVRNCMLISIDKSSFEWMQSLRDSEDFQACIALTDKAKDEQYDMELVLRFITLVDANEATIKNIGDIGEYLGDVMAERATKKSLKSVTTEKQFMDTFRVLASTLIADSFRRFDPNTDRFKGGFLISAFEAIALGIGWNCGDWVTGDQNRVLGAVKALWSNNDFLEGIGSGKRASQRIPVTIACGRNKMKP